MTNAERTFRAKAPPLMRALMAEFPWTAEDAAACAGNGGHESDGFTDLQEDRPTVKGSRGGYGWFQWTGPRRRAYEAWCKKRGLDPASDKANTDFLIHELKGPEKRTIEAVRKARGLEAKTVAFEAAFERAGIKHYDSRKKWARIAMDAFGGSVPLPRQPDDPGVVVPPEPKNVDKSMGKSKTGWGAGILGAIGAAMTWLANLDWRVQIAITAILVAIAGYIWIERKRIAKDVGEFIASVRKAAG